MTAHEYAKELIKKHKVEQGDFCIEYSDATEEATIMSILCFLDAKCDHLWKMIGEDADG